MTLHAHALATLASPPSTTLVARIYQLVVQQATTLAFADASWVLALVTIVLAPLVLLLWRRAPLAARVQASHLAID